MCRYNYQYKGLLDKYQDQSNPSTENTVAAFVYCMTAPTVGLGYLLVFLYTQKQGRMILYNLICNCKINLPSTDSQRLISSSNAISQRPGNDGNQEIATVGMSEFVTAFEIESVANTQMDDDELIRQIDLHTRATETSSNIPPSINHLNMFRLTGQ